MIIIEKFSAELNGKSERYIETIDDGRQWDEHGCITIGGRRYVRVDMEVTFPFDIISKVTANDLHSLEALILAILPHLHKETIKAILASAAAQRLSH